MRHSVGLLALMIVTAGTELSAQSPEPAAAAGQTVPAPPCLGAGYIPYSYPAVDNCSCATDGCFPPARYYCGGEAYRDSWFRKWLRAQFCGGSMLDGYPCHCMFPSVGRVWIPPVARPENQTASPLEPENVYQGDESGH